jgi:hypothetical protein
VAILPLETPRIRRHKIPIAGIEVLLLLSIRSASELPGTVHKPNGALRKPKAAVKPSRWVGIASDLLVERGWGLCSPVRVGRYESTRA